MAIPARQTNMQETPRRNNSASKKAKNKTYIRAGFLLLAIGLAGLTIPIISLGFLRDYAFLEEAAKNGVQATVPTATPSPDVSASPGASPEPVRSVVSRPAPARNPESPEIRDRVIIPSAGINMAMVYTDDADILTKAGWLFPNTSTPDRGGNSVIFGHRFRYLPPVSNTLYSLDKVKMGDVIDVHWRGSIYSYRVSEIKVIEPTDLSVLNPSKDPQITLVTCAPLFSTKYRLVVVAKMF